MITLCPTPNMFSDQIHNIVNDNQAQNIGSSKQALGGEWSRPFCSRPHVESSKGPKTPWSCDDWLGYSPDDQVVFLAYPPKTVTHFAIAAPTHLRPHSHILVVFTLCVCRKNSNTVNVDVPSSVGAPPLNTQLPLHDYTSQIFTFHCVWGKVEIWLIKMSIVPKAGQILLSDPFN